MKDTEKTNIILKQSHSYYNPPVNATGRLVSLAPDDCHSGTPNVWDTFIGHQDAAGDRLFSIYSILFCGVVFIQALFGFQPHLHTFIPSYVNCDIRIALSVCRSLN